MKRSTPWCTPTRSGCEPSSTRSSPPTHGAARPHRSPPRTGVLNAPNGATGWSHPRSRCRAASVVTRAEVAVPELDLPPANPLQRPELRAPTGQPAAVVPAEAAGTTRRHGGTAHDRPAALARSVRGPRCHPRCHAHRDRPRLPSPGAPASSRHPSRHRRDPDRYRQCPVAADPRRLHRGGRSRPPCRLRPAHPAPITTDQPRPVPVHSDPGPRPTETVGRARALAALAKNPTTPHTSDFDVRPQRFRHSPPPRPRGGHPP